MPLAESLPVLAALALLGALATLDETAAVQSWFSQPLPLALLGGWIVGDVHAGLALGLPLQLLAVGNLPVGQPFVGDRVAPLLGALGAATAAGGWLHALPPPLGDGDPARLGWLLLVIALGSVLGDRVVRWERSLHTLWTAAALRRARLGSYVELERCHRRCLGMTALRGALSTTLWGWLIGGVWLGLFAHLPARLVQACSLLPWLVAAAAVGTLVELYGSRRGLRWILGGLVATLALSWALAGGGTP
jgi:mannose/fructose/N-acetylgalactosamine-specific phosphotransferase system component IIC